MPRTPSSILMDPRKVEGAARDEAMRHNRATFTRMAGVVEKDQSKMLLKVVGELDHGGSDVLKPDSTGYRILAEFVRRVNSPRKNSAEIALDPKAPPFFKDVVMMEDRRLLRRVTLSLAGRLPADAESAAIGKDGLKAIPALLDAMMKEDAFYDRLQEAFNDIFLTVGVDGNPDQSVLSYEHFEKSRLWYQKFDLSYIKDENERRKAGYKLAADYRSKLAPGANEADRITSVRNDRPFTEIVRADYTMVSPYTARGYGIYEELKSRFKNPEDPFEFIPVKLKALSGRSPAGAPGFRHRLLSARGIAEHFPVPGPIPDDRDEPQPPAGPHVLPAFPGRRRAGTGAAGFGCGGNHGEVHGPHHAGVRVRDLSQDDRPGCRYVPGLLAIRGPWGLRQAEGWLVHGYVHCRI